MSAVARLLDGLLREPSVTAAALFGTDRRVDHRGAELPVAVLGDVASAARHVFRETSPPIHVLDLSYANGRVVLVPWGDNVLLLRGEASIDLESLLARVRGESPLATAASPLPVAVLPRSPTLPPPSLPAALAPRIVLEALNLVAAEARRTLGGPVIRNYLRRAQKDLAPLHGVLERFDADLEGRITLRDDAALDPAGLGRAAGTWARAFLARARVVVPELGALDLRTAVGPHRAALEAHGFFEADGEKGSP